MLNITIHEVLAGTSERIYERGWTQYRFVSEDGGEECPLETVTRVVCQFVPDGTNQSRKIQTLRAACLQVLDQVLSTHCADYEHCVRQAERKADSYASDSMVIEWSIFLWNDRPGRTRSEVFRVVALAADLLWEARWNNRTPEPPKRAPRYAPDVVFGRDDLSLVLGA